MGQALNKFSDALYVTNIVASQGGHDPLRQLLSLLSQNGELAANGGEENNAFKYGPIIDKWYEKYFTGTNKEWTKADFYRAVSEIVQEINSSLGNTQFRVPEYKIIQEAYNDHHGERGDAKLEREEFQKILERVMVNTRVSGIGAKDTILYIFGVPVSALLLKQRVMPKALPNEIFIPLVTSATVLLLAHLNKI